MKAIELQSKQPLADRDALFPRTQLDLNSTYPDEGDEDFPPKVIPSENSAAVDRYRMSLVTPELERQATTLLDFVDDWALLKMRAQLVLSIYNNEPVSHEALRDTVVIPAYAELVGDYRNEAKRASDILAAPKNGELTLTERRVRGFQNLVASHTSVAAYLEKISTSESTAEIDKKVATYAHIAKKQAIEEVIELLQDKLSSDTSNQDEKALVAKIDTLNNELRALIDLDEEMSGNPDFDKLFATLDTNADKDITTHTPEKPVLRALTRSRTLHALGESAKKGLVHLSKRPPE